MSANHFYPSSQHTHLLHSSLLSGPLLNPSLRVSLPQKVTYHYPISSNDQTRVSLLSGGGSGHEPSFTALVGQGMLSASVAGTIFASPSAKQVEWAVRKLTRLSSKPEGVCVIVMNYTGDILNFGLGISRIPTGLVETKMVVVADDVGVPRSAGGVVGRRGIAGTVLVVKIAGALAAHEKYNATLEEVVKLAELVSGNLVSVGASLGHVHVPGSKVTEKENGGGGEVEIGMGIHNEAGSETAELSIEELVARMLRQLLDQSDKERAFLEISSKDEVVLLVNNLGGVSMLEFTAVVSEVVLQLEGTWKIVPVRILAGTFMTSLNGQGFSISLLKVVDTGLGDGLGMVNLLEAPTEAVGWAAGGKVKGSSWRARRKEDRRGSDREEDGLLEEQVQTSSIRVDYKRASSVLNTALERLIQAESEITKYDTVAGDGDCGTGLKRGAEAIQTKLKNQEPTNDFAVFLSHIASAITDSMDGTSGALFGIYISSLVNAMVSLSTESEADLTTSLLAKGLKQALDSLSSYTPAQPGDRTLMDALVPFVETLNKSGDVREAADVAKKAAEDTKTMKPKLGRTVYVGGDDWKSVPDPGAYGLAILMDGFADGV